MRAYQITTNYGIEGLAIIERDLPQLLPNQILVKMAAVSLNYRDLLVVKGIDKWKPPFGRVPVSDGVGTVIEIGSDVTEVKQNERVAGLFYPNWIEGDLNAAKLENPLGGQARDGVLQEYVIFYENEIIKVPDFLSSEEAATLPAAGLTAWHDLIEKGNIKKGSTVLIQGTGGVSLFSLQFSLMKDAEVILISGSDEKLELARTMGVNNLINYKRHPEWQDEVLNLTNGKGVDHIVEVVGGDHINKSIEAVAIDGTISIIGVIDGLTGNLNTAQIMSKQIKLQGINVGSKEMFTRMNQTMTENHIHPVINNIFSFEEAKEALEKLDRASHYGKICIRF